MLVFYGPTQVPDTVTSKMIHYERDLPLSPDEAWKNPFIMDRAPILAKRIQNALVNGPFIAEAGLGPKFYDGEPTEFTQQIPTHPELPVYGWAPTQRKPKTDGGPYQEIIVCGVQKSGDTEHMYYILAEEVKTDWQSGIAQHKKTSHKVYAASVKRFSDSLNNMYPSAQNEEKEKGLRSAALRTSDLQMKIAALAGQLQDS
jgi:hypothetical protein